MLNILGNFIYDVLKKSAHWLRSFFVTIASIFIFFMAFSLIAGLLSIDKAPGLKTSTINETLISESIANAKIVIAPISGIILADNQTQALLSAESMITPNLIREILNNAESDTDVKAIVFDINSPGGSPVASDRIFEQIQNFKNETQIPVVFLMGDMAASGGYYIASAADYIVANPSTLTGSIGVIMETYNLEELYKKIGVAKNTFKQGEYKDILNEARPITEEEQKIIDSLNENTYNLFISRVASGRNKPEEEIRTLANGRIYSGSQAKDVGLVDSLGNLDEAIYQAKSLANIDDYQVVEYSSGSVLSQFLYGVKSSIFSDLLTNLIYLPKTLWVQR